MYITNQGLKDKFAPNGGELKHQKLQNHQKVKCSKNALSLHQNDALGEHFPMSTILVSFWCIGGALEHQKVKNQRKLKCTKNTLLIYQIDAQGELFKIK